MIITNTNIILQGCVKKISPLFVDEMSRNFSTRWFSGVRIPAGKISVSGLDIPFPEEFSAFLIRWLITNIFLYQMYRPYNKQKQPFDFEKMRLGHM
jgi:hypothetical protein